ncbi:MAG: beta-galactosidase, partial [Lentisphaerae bacterium]|nr:beta-galactosidase [Lentisphaerota bacterium]
MWFERLNSEDAVRRMADAGINFIISRYFKGFGLEAEAPDLAYARKQIKWCRRYGIRYIAYVQCLTLVSETFFKEVPQSREWLRHEADGSVPRYADEAPASWRMEPAIYHQGFIEYLKQVITRAIGQDGADGIMLDNMQAHPCYCSACQQSFRNYVRNSKTFTPEKLALQFLDYDSIEIPPTLTAHDPLSYEYWQFRRQHFVRVLRELQAHIKACHPQALFIPNATAPTITRHPSVMLEDANTPEYAVCFDALKNDGAESPGLDSNRRIVGSMMRFKIANALGTIVVPKNPLGGYAPDVLSDEEVRAHIARTAAEYLAFGGYPVPFMGVLNPTRSDRGRKLNLDYPAVFNAVKAYSGFVRAHADLYTGARTAARVFLYASSNAVCRWPAVMAAVAHRNWDTLLAERLVFGAAPAGKLDALPADAVLLIMDIPAMAAEECDEVIAFQRRGGRLAILGPTSWYNANYQDARAIGLRQLVSSKDAERWEQGELIVRPGLFIEPTPTPEIEKALALRRRHFSETRRASHTLTGIINQLDPDAWVARVTAPDHILVDAYNLPDGRQVIHLYNICNQQAAENVELAIGRGEDCHQIEHFSPDYEEAPVPSWNIQSRECVVRLSR